MNRINMEAILWLIIYYIGVSLFIIIGVALIIAFFWFIYELIHAPLIQDKDD